MWHNFKLRLAVGILAGILALLTLLVVALHTPPVRRYALKQAVEILARQGVDFEASEVDYNLLDLTATLRHVTVRSRQTPDLPPLARIDHLRVDLNLRKLLSGGLYVEDGEIHNPTIHLVVDKDGRDNIPKPPGKESESETDYLIDKLLVSGGSLRVEERRQQIDVTLPVWQLSIDGNPLTSEHDIRLDAREPGRISFQQRITPVQGLTAQITSREN